MKDARLAPVVVVIPCVPPSTNRIWRKRVGGFYLDEPAQRFRRAMFVTLKKNKIEPPDWPYFCVDVVIEPTIRSGDVDNRIKTILDSLTWAKFWKDDKYVAKVSCAFGPVDHAGRGKTTITISPMKEKYPATFF